MNKIRITGTRHVFILFVSYVTVVSSACHSFGFSIKKAKYYFLLTNNMNQME